jgi:HPt (histidine-containing phosphotransfer) domain-containing protein
MRLSTGVNIADRQASSGPCDPEVLDFDGLCERCMGNLDLVQRLLEKFEQWIPEELAELDQALALDDPQRVAQVAHRIKGSSASISAQSLQRAAAEIVELSREGRLADLPASVGQLHGEWERYRGVRG